MTHPTRSLRTLLAAAGLALAVALSQHESSLAQQPIPGADGERSLDAKELKGDERTTFNKLRDGNIDPKAEHVPVLEKAAQWYVYRLTWPQYQRKPLPEATNQTTVNDLVNECVRQIPERAKMYPKGDTRERQFRYIAEYSKEINKAVDEVLKNPMPIARVNAARIMAHLGKVGPEENADAMIRVLEDKNQIDAVKLYALRGLKDLQTTVRETTGKYKDPAREAKIANALTAFIHRDPAEARDSSPEAQRWLRREAVRALAGYRAPAVVVKKEVAARPALELLKIVSKDGVEPAPTIGERTDAAIGVAGMQASLYKNYQPDYAALHLGHFLLDFSNEYNNDRKNSANLREEPWKVTATKLRLALEGMAEDHKTNKNVVAFVARAKPVLEAIEKDQIATSAPLLKRALANFKPEASLFKDDDKAKVKLPTSDN